ncbi:MAG: fused MFS/spermidine synthase [Novosphingobium sp.]
MRHPASLGAVRRPLFVGTVLVGSFLLFLVQPMVARMALPRLGGAPAVWNSAMLVYQALLLGGNAYAHLLARLPLRRQATIHLALLVAAALTLPVHLVALPPPAPGREALWVPALLAASIGPVFFLVSAQAPLMQRWFSAHPGAGEPYALYAASNLGSFAGLIAYPLLAEPLLPLAGQTLGWSLGYGLLIALVAATAWARRQVRSSLDLATAPVEQVPGRRILLWLALAAVPSGLMLSTTTHLTTDLFAMPLLWVIPLGLYLLSFVPAFSDRRGFARWTTRFAPLVLLSAGGMAAISRENGSLLVAAACLVLLFVVAVALHARLYALRPPPEQLTLFYLVMSAGGALGGLFAALIAPLVFDWVWEHPLLVLAAAALLPIRPLLHWRRLSGIEPGLALIATLAFIAVALAAAWPLFENWPRSSGMLRLGLGCVIVGCGLLVADRRWSLVTVLGIMMLAQGGVDTLQTSWSGARTRSYFGIYTVRQYPGFPERMLAHGTTLHGMQYTDRRRLQPTTYYSETSGVGIAMARTPQLYGPGARIGVVGLGTGTLACWARPGQRWTIFEIDPAVVALSRRRVFTFLPDCAPQARIRLGDARLELARTPSASFDVLAIDAFSSDAIPLHLLTVEALDVYMRALSTRGVLMLHISNRYFELEPQLAQAIRARGWAARELTDHPPPDRGLSASVWVAVARDEATLAPLTAGRDDWVRLPDPHGTRAWTDDHASILPAVRWENLLGKVL